jgi:hypothetical protein
VDVPGLGRVTVRQEPYDEKAQDAAVERVPSRQMPRLENHKDTKDTKGRESSIES